jgi:hypothetical protein
MVMRNDKREHMARTVLTVFVVWTLLFSGIVGFGASFMAVAGEEPIEPMAGYDCPAGNHNWTGDHYFDGDLNLAANCILTVRDGGITIFSDDDWRYSVNINAQAELRLVNSYLTAGINQIKPYLILPVTVAGTLYGENAMLQFPGFINVTGTIELWDSDVTAITDFQGVLSNPDEFNDAPVLTFFGGEGQFYRTSIDTLYTSTRPGGRNDPATGFMYDFNVTGNSRVWFVDTYLGIDYDLSPLSHNQLWVRDTSLVFAYNLTIETSLGANRIGAIRTSTSGVAHILRWANVLCVDNEGVPIEGVTLDPVLVTTSSRPNFPDSLGQTPHAYILNYLGETALTWLVTGPNGKSLIPLPSEFIDDTVVQTTPNAEYYGPYEVTGTYNALTSSHTFSFDPYPAMDDIDGTVDVTLVFDTLLPKPDLIGIDIRWTPANPVEGDKINFSADIQNIGPTGANFVYVCFYVDGQPLNNTPTRIDFINGPNGIETTPKVPPDLEVFWPDATGGNHTVLVVADCLGGVSEADENNNGYTETLYVVPLIPDYEIQSGYIGFPPTAYIGNPVQINITIWNIGKDLAPENTVRIYIGDPSLGGAVQIGEVPISNISVNSTTQAFFIYTFNEAKDYKICAWVDADVVYPGLGNVFEESELNNMACRILTVALAPNLAVTTNDIGVGDPCTRMGQTVTPQAVVRNIGYVRRLLR